MFRYPWMLGLFPVLALLYLRPWFLRRPLAPQIGLWKRSSPSWRTRLWWLAEAWDLALLLVICLLLAGPEVQEAGEETQKRGLSLAVVLDRSASMGAEVDAGGDRVPRFDGVKNILKEFFQRRPDDAVTLISFAGFPETHTPLTANPEVLIGFLDVIPLALDTREGGTAMGDALVLACARLKNARAPGEKDTGAILLLTDGRNNSGEASPQQATRLAKSLGIKIFPIGLGGKGILQLESMSPEAVNLDVAGLQEIAKGSGGQYFQADSLAALGDLMKALESGVLSQLRSFTPPMKRLDLEGGLWVLLVLVLGSPWVRTSVLRRRPL